MRRQPLVTAGELAEVLRSSAEQPTLLDVRWRYGAESGEPEYSEGHLPGAYFVDLDTELCGAADVTGRRPIPRPEDFTAAMRRYGVSSSRPVVVYDADDSSGAARAWWILRYFGHPDVRVLDGGFSAWSRSGGPVERGGREPGGDGDFVAVPGGMPVCDAEGAALTARSGTLLDARSSERYLGDVKATDRAGGHIPGAICTPTTEYSNADGTFRSAKELLHRAGECGVTRGSGKTVGVYCGSGISATHTLLALASVGVTASLYPGSWSHWLTDPERPIASGPEPG